MCTSIGQRTKRNLSAECAWAVMLDRQITCSSPWPKPKHEQAAADLQASRGKRRWLKHGFVKDRLNFVLQANGSIAQQEGSQCTAWIANRHTSCNDVQLANVQQYTHRSMQGVLCCGFTRQQYTPCNGFVRHTPPQHLTEVRHSITLLTWQ